MTTAGQPGGDIVVLRRPRFWSGRFARISVGLMLGGVVGSMPAVLRASQPADVEDILGLATILSGAYVLLAGFRFLRLSRRAPVIRFMGDHVRLPLTAESRRTAIVKYEHILSIAKSGSPRRQQLVIGSRGRTFVYPEDSFADRQGAAVLQRTLMVRLAALPDAHLIRAGFERRHRVQAAASARPVPVTKTILATLLATFLLQRALDSDYTTAGLVRMGGNAATLVHEGQLFRLVTANFLHGGWLHLVVNGIAILSLSSLLERLLGPSRVLTIYLSSALAGAMASSLVPRVVPSVGSSTAVFGLLGGLALTNYRYFRELPLGLRQPIRWWIIIFGINGALPLLVPQIDWAAHLGGLAAGIIGAFAMLRNKSVDQAMAPPSRTIKRVARVLVALFVLGVCAAIYRNATAGAEDARSVMEAIRLAAGAETE